MIWPDEAANIRHLTSGLYHNKVMHRHEVWAVNGVTGEAKMLGWVEDDVNADIRSMFEYSCWRNFFGFK